MSPASPEPALPHDVPAGQRGRRFVHRLLVASRRVPPSGNRFSPFPCGPPQGFVGSRCPSRSFCPGPKEPPAPLARPGAVISSYGFRDAGGSACVPSAAARGKESVSGVTWVTTAKCLKLAKASSNRDPQFMWAGPGSCIKSL